MSNAGDAARPLDHARAGNQGPNAAAVEEYRSLLQEAEGRLDEVDRALDALDAGTYGLCDVCGVPLGDVDLGADPLLTRCATHRVRTGH